MTTVLLLTNSAETPRLLAEILGPQTSVVLLRPPPEPGRQHFDELWAPWLPVAEAVLLDGPALGETMRWAVESLAARSPEHLAVVARFTAAQQSLYTVPASWLVVADTEAPEQVRLNLVRFFERHEARHKVARLEAVLARVAAANPRRAPAAPAGGGAAAGEAVYHAHRYRDALKNISLLLSQRHDQATLLKEFARLLRELFGINKLALFIRAQPGQPLALACSVGLKQELAAQLRLGPDTGLGGALARDGKILRRELLGDPLSLDYDPQMAREFEWFGAEVAVPMIDNDQLLGVLLFGGKITGEALANDELELIYHLLSQLGQALHQLRLLDQIEAQERLLSEVLANVQSGVVVIGADRRILHVNHRARELLTLGAGDLAGQDISRIPSRVADVIFEALQTGQEIRGREVTLVRDPRPLAVSASRFTPTTLTGAALTQGRGPVAVALIDDLTQVKLQQRQARELADREFFMRLTERMEHELKNALTPISTFAQLLPAQYADKEFQEQIGPMVLQPVDRLVVLLDNLRFFAQPLELKCEDLTLSDLLEAGLKNIAEEFAPRHGKVLVNAGEKPPALAPASHLITVKRNFGHTTPAIAGDKVRLRQAFGHLLRNAVQSLPEGGRLIIDTADATPADFPSGQPPAGGAVSIEFHDTGEGIPLEDLPRVTEPFVTTRNTGVGLGLTIVKRIIERHGGRLEIDSMLGRGTTILLLLPVKTPPHPAEQSADEPRGATPHEAWTAADLETGEPRRRGTATTPETRGRRPQ